MTTMITELYDALKDAGASEEKDRQAAQALAHHDNRFDRIDAELALLRKDMQSEIGSLGQKMQSANDMLRKDMEAMENRLILKLGGLIAIGFGAMAVLVKLL